MKTTIELAREAGCSGIDNFEVIERFAALVRADEREACAQVCDDLHPDWKWRAAESIRARRSNT